MPAQQRFVVLLGYIIAGIISLGAILDAVSNSIALITILRAVILSSIILVIWILIELMVKWRRLEWRDKNGKML